MKQTKKYNASKLFKPILVGSLITLLFVLSIYISCQPIEKKDPLLTVDAQKALSVQQIDRANTTVMGIGRIESAALEAKALGIQPQIDDALEKTLKELLLANQCTILYSKNNEPEGPKSSTLVISGPTCPVAVTILKKFEGNLEGKISFTAKIDIKDEAFAKQNDISSVNLKGNGQYKKTNEVNKVDFQISGELTSISHGKISFSLSDERVQQFETPTQISESGKKVLKLIFLKSSGSIDFVAELKQTLSIDRGQDHSLYQLNGVNLTKSDFETQWSRLGLISQ